MKLLRTSNTHIVSDCQQLFDFVLLTVQLARSAEISVDKLHVS